MKAIDVHTHIGVDKVYGYSQTDKELIEKMDMADVERAVVLPFPRPEWRIKGENDLVAQAVKRYPDRLKGFFIVDPVFIDDAIAEIERAVNELKLKGLMLDIDVLRIPRQKFEGVLEKANALKLPILLHSHHALSMYTLPMAGWIDRIARTYPELILIWSVMGTIGIDDVMKRNENVVVDTSTARYAMDLMRLIPSAGATKIVFGSNAPIEHPYVKRKVVDNANIPDEQKEQILRENSARILKI